MKLRNLLFILICALFLPFVVNAKEYCKVVSGNGKDIGSEIACGSEHFYIVNVNKDEVKMLAKYNLYIGYNTYKEKLADNQSCSELATSKGGVERNDSFYNDPGYCFYTKNIETDQVVQSEEAVSAHWDENDNYLYPQIGDVNLEGTYNLGVTDGFYADLDSSSKYDNYFYDLKFGEANHVKNDALNKYKLKLENDNYSLTEIDLLSLDDLNSIIKKNNKVIPFADWYNHTREIVPPHYEFGSLNELLVSHQSFLYNTTYWLKNGYDINNSFNPPITNSVVFVNSIGGVCGSNTFTFPAGYNSNCQVILGVSTQMGAGIRPVITIPSNELQYLIQTKTDGNGTIEVVENALGNETIQFKATSKKGYKLKSIVITTDSGEVVEFDEGEIIQNEDGTYSIDKSKFTMPFENVTIEARWSLDIMNPKTGRKLSLFILLIVILFVSIKEYYKIKSIN